MDDLFLINHIFVVFHPGAGGNFIASLAHSLINPGRTIEFSSRGSAHNLISDKLNMTDYLSYSTFPILNRPQSPAEEYALSIKNNKDRYSSRTVSWTHDFENIELYSKVFSKARILVATQDSIYEKLVVTAMHVLKLFLDPETVVTSTVERQAAVLSRWKLSTKADILNINPNVSHDTIYDILENRYSSRYANILEYLTIRRAFIYYGLIGLVDEAFPIKSDNVNFVRYNAPEKSYIRFCQGDAYSNYITERCKIIRYEEMINRDHSFVQTMIDITGNDDSKYIYDILDKYRIRQNQDLLLDPVLFYKSRKQEAIDIMKSLK
jgi:hypothetical protein